jgi:hypothetical protein
MYDLRSATYIEAISAMEVLTSMKPIQHIKNIHINPAVPPLRSPMVETLQLTSLVSQPIIILLVTAYLKENSHDAIRIMEKPKMDKNRKFLYHVSSAYLHRIESYGIGVHLHFLGFAHTVHVGPIGIGPILLVDMAIIVDAYHGALDFV